MPDLRTFLRQSEEEKDLSRITREVSPIFEASAIMKYHEAEHILFFERVTSSKFPVVLMALRRSLSAYTDSRVILQAVLPSFSRTMKIRR